MAKIKSRFSFWRSEYDFELADGSVYYFHCEKVWKRVFVCESDKERFHQYEHKGLNYSIFQNSQIASFSRNSLKIGKGDEYEIRMNDDANLVVVICLARIIDSAENKDNDATVTYDFGNVGPEDRAI